MPLRLPPDDAEDKLRDIRSVTDAALAFLDADELLAALLDRVRAILDGDTAAVLLLDSSAVSWSPLRLAGWRRKSVRVSGSRLAGVSRDASPRSGARSS